MERERSKRKKEKSKEVKRGERKGNAGRKPKRRGPLCCYHIPDNSV